MTAILACGGCAACERCEALRWACNQGVEYLATIAGCRINSATTDDRSRYWQTRFDAAAIIRDPARAAELLRALLEARGLHTEVAYDEPMREMCIAPLDYPTYWPVLVDNLPALIPALLGIEPGEQREAAMRVVEEAR